MSTIAVWSIENVVQDWSETEGAGIAHWQTLDESGMYECENESEALIHICEKFGFDSKVFQTAEQVFGEKCETDNGRYMFNRIENNDGEADEKGKFLTEYNVYITMYTQQRESEAALLQKLAKFRAKKEKEFHDIRTRDEPLTVPSLNNSRNAYFRGILHGIDLLTAELLIADNNITEEK